MAVEGSVSIGGAPFPIYGAFADATTYFKAHTNAAAWDSASTTGKNQALVSSARSFDRQTWLGLPTDLVTPQALAWPRTGVTDRNGQAVADDVIPDDVAEASWEWALELLRNGAIAEATPGTNTKRISTREKVDVIETSTDTELFKSTVGRVSRFPIHIMELISVFLGGGAEVLAFSSGTDAVTVFGTDDTDFGFDSTGIDGGANG